MFRFNSRAAHYALLTAAHLILTLPNLGAHTLWDMSPKLEMCRPSNVE